MHWCDTGAQSGSEGEAEVLEALHARRRAARNTAEANAPAADPAHWRECAKAVNQYDVLEIRHSPHELWVGYVYSLCRTEEKVEAVLRWDDGDSDSQVVLFSSASDHEQASNKLPTSVTTNVAHTCRNACKHSAHLDTFAVHRWNGWC